MLTMLNVLAWEIILERNESRSMVNNKTTYRDDLKILKQKQTENIY